MKISYKWLQGYFEEKLPPPERLAELITFGFAEVESIETIDADRRGLSDTQINADKKDTILDVKVLPDRACYALSHRGIAREISAIAALPLKSREAQPMAESSSVPALQIAVETPKLCTKFVARRIENINVGPSPSWLRDALEAIGQRSINNIVDITNFVMFDIGRPTHTFDADKVKGRLVVRLARKGETIMLLDNKLLTLTEKDLVIADDEGPVAQGGIKGGKRTEVDANTRNVILEAANWNPSYIRLASTRTGIKTEASRRFENRLSPLLAEEGSEAVTRLILEIAGTRETKVGKKVSISHEETVPKILSVDAKSISRKLGIPLTEEDVVSSLKRLGIACDGKRGKLFAHIPPERLDLTIPEDIAEEVGRIIGYDKIPAELPPKTKGEVEIPKSFYYEWKVREALIGVGFSEIQTSSFSEKGDVAVLKPLAEDKKYARPNLRNNFEKALKMNALNTPLFGIDETKLFEIGRVFPARGEHAALAVGVAGRLKKEIANTLETVAEVLYRTLGVGVKGESTDGVWEVHLDAMFAKLPEPKKWDISIPLATVDRFVPFSSYPFIVRDISLFVESEDVEEKVRLLIFEMAKKSADKLLIKGPGLFDTFEKDGKKSLAFRLVFQSFEHTLTDEEVNGFMEKIYGALKMKGWEVR